MAAVCTASRRRTSGGLEGRFGSVSVESPYLTLWDGGQRGCVGTEWEEGYGWGLGTYQCVIFRAPLSHL